MVAHWLLGQPMIKLLTQTSTPFVPWEPFLFSRGISPSRPQRNLSSVSPWCLNWLRTLEPYGYLTCWPLSNWNCPSWYLGRKTILENEEVHLKLLSFLGTNPFRVLLATPMTTLPTFWPIPHDEMFYCTEKSCFLPWRKTYSLSYAKKGIKKMLTNEADTPGLITTSN